MYREKKKTKQLKKQMAALVGWAGVSKARAKEVEHEAYLDKKASQKMALEKEKEHQATLQELTDDFNPLLQEAHDATNGEMGKRLVKEQARILDTSTYTYKIWEERRRAPETWRSNNNALQKQREHKKKKQEIAKAEGMEKASDEFIDALWLWRPLLPGEA